MSNRYESGSPATCSGEEVTNELEFPVQRTDNYKSFFILYNSFYNEIPLNSNNMYISFKQK